MAGNGSFWEVETSYLIFAADDRFTVVAASRTYFDTSSVQKRAFLGLGLAEAFPRSSHELRRSLERVITTRLPDTMRPPQCRIGPATTQPLQENRLFRSINSPVFGRNDEILYVIHCLSELKGLGGEEEERSRRLEASNSALSAENAQLKHLVSLASHDLQEPLRTLVAHLEWIASNDRDRLGDENRQHLNFAMERALRMSALIKDLLNYSTIGIESASFHTINLNEAMGDAIANLKATIEENKATISVERLPTVLANRLQMVQLFQNLLGNAVKFRGDMTPHVKVAVEVLEDVYLFSFKDNGIGIDPSDHQKVFGVLQRLHSDRKKYPGSGIGLAICKEIVELHGGQIWVESAIASGSTFFVKLPRRTN
ncbi:MAG: hypothetical protein HYZ71_17220 [Deltaproteobacteria bacterium]|nr:hypothetical protein [Deltaproteobacteria bacterium]